MSPGLRYKDARLALLNIVVIRRQRLLASGGNRIGSTPIPGSFSNSEMRTAFRRSRSSTKRTKSTSVVITVKSFAFAIPKYFCHRPASGQRREHASSLETAGSDDPPNGKKGFVEE